MRRLPYSRCDIERLGSDTAPGLTSYFQTLQRTGSPPVVVFENFGSECTTPYMGPDAPLPAMAAVHRDQGEAELGYYIPSERHSSGEVKYPIHYSER